MTHNYKGTQGRNRGIRCEDYYSYLWVSSPVLGAVRVHKYMSDEDKAISKATSSKLDTRGAAVEQMLIQSSLVDTVDILLNRSKYFK